MNYANDVLSMGTLAHELGHSMHSYFSWQNQPMVYADYSLFVAEVASNFNQAMVRAHLLKTHADDPAFQIAVIEEAMYNFRRYFFLMPTLARFELAIHEQVEQGDALTADGMIDLLKRAAHRDGFGDEISQGSWRLANAYGHPEASITAKKLEFPSYDARGLKGMGLLYATSNIGASHMAGDTAYTELFGVGKKVDGLTYEGKAELTKHFQDIFTLIDAAGLLMQGDW